MKKYFQTFFGLRQTYHYIFTMKSIKKPIIGLKGQKALCITHSHQKTVHPYFHSTLMGVPFFPRIPLVPFFTPIDYIFNCSIALENNRRQNKLLSNSNPKLLTENSCVCIQSLSKLYFVRRVRAHKKIYQTSKSGGLF